MCTGNEVRVGTANIAAAFGRRHEQVKLLIARHKGEFEKLGELKTVVNAGRTKPFAELTLTENQVCLLGVLFKNTKRTVTFKQRLIADYGEQVRFLGVGDVLWDNEVLIKKVATLPTNQLVNDFMDYATAQGCTQDQLSLYSKTLREMLCEILAACERKFVYLRSLMTPDQLMVLGGADAALARNLGMGMVEGVYHETLHSRVTLGADMLLAMINPPVDQVEESI